MNSRKKGAGGERELSRDLFQAIWGVCGHDNAREYSEISESLKKAGWKQDYRHCQICQPQSMTATRVILIVYGEWYTRNADFIGVAQGFY